MEVSNRDIAAVVGVGLLALVLYRQHALGDIARSFAHVIALMLKPPLGLMGLLLIAWVALLVLSAQRVGLWVPEMTKDTVLSVIPAYALMMKASEATRHDHFYRRQIGRLIRWTVVVEVFVGQVTYNLPVEVFLLVVLSIAGGISVLREPWDTTGGVAPRWARYVLGIGGLILLAAPVSYLIQNAGSIDVGQELRDIAQPVWLTVGCLPLLYFLSLTMTYEWAQAQLTIRGPEPKASWRGMAALLAVYNVRASALDRWTRTFDGPHNLSRATSFREALRIAREAKLAPSPAPEPETDEDDPWANDDAPAPATRPARKRERPHGRRRSR